jgi:hypothetical protein
MSGHKAITEQVESDGVPDTDSRLESASAAATALAAETPSPKVLDATAAASAADSPIGEPPALHTIGVVPPTRASVPVAFNSRSGRYLQPRAPAPAKRVTTQDLDRIAHLYEVGDAAHLVLQFGDYRGATLVQVAQADPNYLRKLAMTAQRPQVRAAASALVRALEVSERPANRRRQTRSTSSTPQQASQHSRSPESST